MSTIVVTKSPAVVVRPWETVTTVGKKSILSPFDKPLIGLPSTVLYVFEQPIHEPVETIRRGLSKALVHYYPLAGRVAGDNNTGDVHIDCTGEGLTFVAASADCAITELTRHVDRRKSSTVVLQELGVNYPTGRCGRADPMVLMQVTVFRCGGFIVGVTWNHGVADGFGIARFVQTVGELARGLPTPSVVPVVAATPPQVVPPLFTLAIYQASFEFPALDLAASNITIPASLISRIRRGDSKQQQCRCSFFELATSVLWRCRTRVVMSDPEAPTAVVFSVNSRKHMGLSDGYYGNCTTTHMVMEKSGVVANADVMDLVGMIRRAKEQIPEHFKENGDVAGMLQVIGELRGRAGYENVMSVTCWRNIGFEGADFGGGTPERVMTYSRNLMVPICVVCLPCNDGEEGAGACRVMSACVKPQHSDAFLQEIDTL